MKVKELKKLLEKYNDNLEVLISVEIDREPSLVGENTDIGCYHDITGKIIKESLWKNSILFLECEE